MMRWVPVLSKEPIPAWTRIDLWQDRLFWGVCAGLCHCELAHFCRLCWGTLALLPLYFILDSAESRGCSTFFCGKSYRVSPPNADPGSPLFLTPYLEKGAVAEGAMRPHGWNRKPAVFLTIRIRMIWSLCCFQPGNWVWLESCQELTSGVMLDTWLWIKNTTATSSFGSFLHSR